MWKQNRTWIQRPELDSGEGGGRQVDGQQTLFPVANLNASTQHIFLRTEILESSASAPLPLQPIHPLIAACEAWRGGNLSTQTSSVQSYLAAGGKRRLGSTPARSELLQSELPQATKLLPGFGAELRSFTERPQTQKSSTTGRQGTKSKSIHVQDQKSA